MAPAAFLRNVFFFQTTVARPQKPHVQIRLADSTFDQAA